MGRLAVKTVAGDWRSEVSLCFGRNSPQLHCVDLRCVDLDLHYVDLDVRCVDQMFVDLRCVDLDLHCVDLRCVDLELHCVDLRCVDLDLGDVDLSGDVPLPQVFSLGKSHVEIFGLLNCLPSTDSASLACRFPVDLVFDSDLDPRWVQSRGGQRAGLVSLAAARKVDPSTCGESPGSEDGHGSHGDLGTLRDLGLEVGGGRGQWRA